MEIEDQIELAHILEVSVEHLDEMMDDIKHDQLIVIFLNACCKVETGVASEHYLVFAPFEEVGQPWGPSNDHRAYLWKSLEI